MTVALSALANGTIFVHDSREWEKGSMGWGSPVSGHPDCYPEIVGVPSTQCFPRYGGGIQRNMGKFLPDDLQVSVY